jgi:hypothetical protein
MSKIALDALEYNRQYSEVFLLSLLSIKKEDSLVSQITGI